MNITPLDVGAWISICCGLTLLRSSAGPRRSENSGSGHKRVITGALLMIVGLAALSVTLAYHFLRGH
jgi:hypothetical protein